MKTKKVNWKTFMSILISILFFTDLGLSQNITSGNRPKTPIMGWASWNNFHVKIDEKTIQSQADFMVSTGMHDEGYSYINIDDGYFGGRDKNGNLLINLKKFPQGMKAVADYIHFKGLKAGIYSDAGINTCTSKWDKDTIGSGCGLFGHEHQDLNMVLKDWGSTS
ncbi:alpha-galactosidase precursor [Aquipluma nitroreducens]|uniref:Alpha-galactosidase n=1 Tax=Aquipluma nitroreducens TaxID=2010828 RepID=A0A5K7SF29_9BACT|nr:alpha-galactosidase [Aquipluma nitroreducens]BBE20200.1 alpha-galactosidase precursor [Aquipluma nitroreducens]